MVRVEHVLDSWKAIRQDTAAAVEEFPAGEMDFRPAPGLMTFRETAHHILDASHALTGMLLAGDDNFATPDFRERVKRHMTGLGTGAGAAELAAALRGSLEERTGQLAAQGPAFFAHIVTWVDGQKLTRLEMVQMLKEHELTHRALLFLCLRMKGIVPATTRRRLARQTSK